VPHRLHSTDLTSTRLCGGGAPEHLELERVDSVRRGESVGEPWSLVRDELLAELRK
jgi:hypothetical protein